MNREEFYNDIDKLAGLKDGWLDGYGYKPSRLLLDWFTRSYEEIEDEIPYPYIFPTPDGGINLEWNLPNIDAEMEIPPSKIGEFFFTYNDSLDAKEDLFDLNKKEEWNRFVSLFKKYNRS